MCSCVQACVGGTVSWVVVLEGALRLVRRVGTCNGGNGSNSVVLDGEIVADVRTQLGLETLAPTGDVTAVDPSEVPTRYPSKGPTLAPTPVLTSADPTLVPTRDPSEVPTLPPTPVLTDMDPTPVPTANPTNKPTISPTKEPTVSPTKEPTANPTKKPTVNPTKEPTANPTKEPTDRPTPGPTKSCKKNQVLFNLDLQTDDNGKETSWILKMKKKNGKYGNILKGKGYASNTLYRKEICIRKKMCYQFIIKDANGNGLCCEHGKGYYRITQQGAWLVCHISITSWAIYHCLQLSLYLLRACILSWLTCFPPSYGSHFFPSWT